MTSLDLCRRTISTWETAMLRTIPCQNRLPQLCQLDLVLLPHSPRPTMTARLQLHHLQILRQLLLASCKDEHPRRRLLSLPDEPIHRFQMKSQRDLRLYPLGHDQATLFLARTIMASQRRVKGNPLLRATGHQVVSTCITLVRWCL